MHIPVETKWGKASIRCNDGTKRPVEPGVLPLADGVPSRMGKLRAAGNAIVPQVAAEVIKIYKDMIYER
jgi:DNA (cytosine-5)-methyltransferase 1